MAAGATGTPTALGIPKYNTSADAPSGVGFNSAMDTIDTLIAARAASADVVLKTLADAKGDLIVGTAADTFGRLAIGSNGQVLTADTAEATGAKWATPAVTDPVQLRITTAVDVTNTTTETNLLSHSVAGNLLGTNKMLRFVLGGDGLFNSATTDSLTLRVKFGATTLLQDASTGAAITATRWGWVMHGYLMNLGVTNSQMASMFFLNTETGASATTGYGTFAGLDINTSSRNHPTGGVISANTLGALDTTTAQTLAVTAQWNVTTANVSLRMRFGLLELV